MEDTEIVAADMVRSLERALTPATTGGIIGGYFVDVYLPDVIEGARAYADGEADHVSGLESPDPHTLVVHLTEPTGDLGYRLSQPQLGPIPANPARPGDPQGVAQGHPWDYGDFIVSSGPYMFEGAEALDFSLRPLDQRPPEGNGIAQMTLVRNPSWSRATDDLHAAVPDRIEFYPIPDVESADRLVRSGAIDLVLDWSADPNSIDRWQGEADLRDRVHVSPAEGFVFLALNVAVPPLDDLEVRRAIGMAVDRVSLLALLREGYRFDTQVFTHSALDSLENNLLLTYAPPGVGPRTNLRAARAAMARSRYDVDGDGRCDKLVCTGIQLWIPEYASGWLPAGHAIAAQLGGIGLGIESHVLPQDAPWVDPASHRPLFMAEWLKDFPSASTFLPVLFGAKFIRLDGANHSMVGATPSMLRRYGYDVPSVPSVEDRIAECEPQVFQAQVRCYAEFDQYLSEQVVPVIPLAQFFAGWAVSERVRGFTTDSLIPIPLPSIGAVSVAGEPTAPAPVPPAPAPPPGLPDGLYRTILTARDASRFGMPEDRVGTWTVTLDAGWFELHGTSEGHVIGGDPIVTGRYEGSNGRVHFDAVAPYGGFEGPRLRWALEGDSVRFRLARCTGPAAHDRGLCGFERALFTAHPWTPVPT
jgi:ABC-type transport system substrate-binding protein